MLVCKSKFICTYTCPYAKVNVNAHIHIFREASNGMVFLADSYPTCTTGAHERCHCIWLHVIYSSERVNFNHREHHKSLNHIHNAQEIRAFVLHTVPFQPHNTPAGHTLIVPVTSLRRILSNFSVRGNPLSESPLIRSTILSFLTGTDTE